MNDLVNKYYRVLDGYANLLNYLDDSNLFSEEQINEFANKLDLYLSIFFNQEELTYFQTSDFEDSLRKLDSQKSRWLIEGLILLNRNNEEFKNYCNSLSVEDLKHNRR